MSEYVLLKPHFDAKAKKNYAAGDTIAIDDARLAQWLDEQGAISISGEVRLPAVMRSARTQVPPRKRCCGR